jgi:positive regulator of sigma E activity
MGNQNQIQTKIPIWENLETLAMEDVGIFDVHLVYFTAIWYFLWPLVFFMVIWYVAHAKKNLATLNWTATKRLDFLLVHDCGRAFMQKQI